jgi:hypothetical protein
MDAETRVRAEARLAEAAAALQLADPRPPLRERLKMLRQKHPDAFSKAVEHYEQAVLPGLTADDPMPAWLDYARFLGQLTANGRLLAIGEDGVAAAFLPPLSPGALVLFIPDDTAVPAFVAAQPQRPSAAQQASMDLLVRGRLSLSGEQSGGAGAG